MVLYGVVHQLSESVSAKGVVTTWPEPNISSYCCETCDVCTIAIEHIKHMLGHVFDADRFAGRCASTARKGAFGQLAPQFMSYSMHGTRTFHTHARIHV